MKLSKFFLPFCFLFSPFVLICQNELGSFDDPYINYEVIHLEECTGLIHLYIKVNSFQEEYKTSKGKNSVQVFIEGQNDDQPYTLNEKNEIQVFNLIPDLGGFNIKVLHINDVTQKTRVDYIIHDPKPSPGLVTTTKRMEKLLTEYQALKDTPSKNTTIIDFFCGKEVTRIELLAFLKDYLELSTEELCEIIDKYNDHFGSFYTSISNTQWIKELCNWFEEFIKNSNGGGNNGNSSSCLCKLIQTTSAAVNHTSIFTECQNPLDDTNDCLNFEPLSRARNLADNGPWGDEDNEMQYNELRVGAAKGATFLHYMDGLDIDTTAISTRPLISEITYNLVCIDPNTINVSLDSCSCTKYIDFQYLYHSDIKGNAVRGQNTLLGHTHSSYMNISDFAILTFSNGDEVETEYEGWVRTASCLSGGDEPEGIDSTAIFEGVDLVQNVLNTAQNLSGLTLDSAATLAVEVIDYIQSNLLSESCGDPIDDNMTLLSGNKSFVLEPGNRFSAVLMSGTTFTGFNRKKGESYGTVNSTFYMSAVLLSDQDAVETDYCECEKVGSYVLGSVEEFPAPIPNDRDSENDFDLDWANLYTDPSTPLSVLRNMAGTFLGVEGGDWNDEFEYICGGCNIVELPCYADCVYVRGCDNDTDGQGNVTNNQLILFQTAEDFVANVLIDTREKNQEAEEEEINILSEKFKRFNYQLAPNPTNGLSNLIMQNPPSSPAEITIVDQLGKIVYRKTKINLNNKRQSLDLTSLTSGIYFTIVKYGDQFLTKKIIKI